MRNFAYPKETLSEISLFVEQNAMQNFPRLHEISMIWEQWVHRNIRENSRYLKYRTISANFVEIRSHYFCTVLQVVDMMFILLKS